MQQIEIPDKERELKIKISDLKTQRRWCLDRIGGLAKIAAEKADFFKKFAQICLLLNLEDEKQKLAFKGNVAAVKGESSVFADMVVDCEEDFLHLSDLDSQIERLEGELLIEMKGDKDAFIAALTEGREKFDLAQVSDELI